MYSLAGFSLPGNLRHRLGYVDVTRAELHTNCCKLQTFESCNHSYRLHSWSEPGPLPSNRVRQAMTLCSGKINFPDHPGQRL